MGRNILVCTLGGSWAVVPEVYGFLAPDRLPLYAHHPALQELEAARRERDLAAPDEIWIGSTAGRPVRDAVDKLLHWQTLLDSAPIIRVWLAKGTDQLASGSECRHVRELLLRICLRAHHSAGGGQVVLSLAGGRKTMSADLQYAGQVFGCRALVHVVGQDPPDRNQRDPLHELEPDDLVVPFPETLCPRLVPLVVGWSRPSELLDLELDAGGAISAQRYPVPQPDSRAILEWPAPLGEWLTDELRRREQQSSDLLGNYLASVADREHHENWRSLYRLPPRVIETLREKMLDATMRDWLLGLPKADLHRHLGGCLDLDDQRRVGQAIWDNLTSAERDAALDFVHSWLSGETWPDRWDEELKGDRARRPHRAAALLVKADDTQLEQNLYAATEPRVALNDKPGFWAYELPGELSGSALLAHSAAIETYAESIVRHAQEEALTYVELRGSPQKYRCDAVGFLRDLRAALDRAQRSTGSSSPTVFRFIVIVDRRLATQVDKVARVVDMAVQAREELGDFVAGLDLAGDETWGRPEEIASCFLPAFAVCLPLTIHAGEGKPAKSIWQAAYHLHADRIGHGLSIGQRAQLAERFRDRGICLELCPTSNREVVGFHDSAIPATAGCPTYPLQELWQAGLPLTICTDNPGISRTTLVDEYLTVARMVPDGLSCWDALAMLKQAFTHAFLPTRRKEQLLKAGDAEVYRSVLARFPSDQTVNRKPETPLV